MSPRTNAFVLRRYAHLSSQTCVCRQPCRIVISPQPGGYLFDHGEYKNILHNCKLNGHSQHSGNVPRVCVLDVPRRPASNLRTGAKVYTAGGLSHPVLSWACCP